jgi:MFS family permease
METKQENENTSDAPSPAAEDTQTGSFRSVLENRSFLLLWLAQLLSQLVFNAGNYGVIAYVTAITHSTIMVSFAIISFTLPALPFSLLAGALVDHMSKRFVLWVSNILRAAVTGVIVLALLLNPHTPVPLFFLAFALSLVTQFFIPAEASAIPLLVKKNNLLPALSLFNITQTLAQAFGFLVVGGLITALFQPFQLSLGFTTVQVQSFDILFVVVAVVYAICTLLILAIPAAALHEDKKENQQWLKSFSKKTGEIIEHDVKETWAFLLKNQRLMFALLRFTYIAIVLLVIGEIAGPFVVNVLHRPIQELPFIMAPAGVGLILGGLIMPYITHRLGKARTITTGSFLSALGLALIPFSHFILSLLSVATEHIIYVIGGITFFAGIALEMVNIPSQTVMQEEAPEEERARVFAFQSLFYNAGSIPVLLFVGVIADILGIETVMYLLAGSLLGFNLWAARNRV